MRYLVKKGQNYYNQALRRIGLKFVDFQNIIKARNGHQFSSEVLLKGCLKVEYDPYEEKVVKYDHDEH